MTMTMAIRVQLFSGGEEAVLVQWNLSKGTKAFLPRLGAPLQVSRSTQDVQGLGAVYPTITERSAGTLPSSHGSRTVLCGMGLLVEMWRLVFHRWRFPGSFLPSTTEWFGGCYAHASSYVVLGACIHS